MAKKKKYSIVIPAFNEETNIEPLLSRIQSVFKNLSDSYEVVVVNNGSWDQTAETLRRIQSKMSNLVNVHLTRNFGYDGAIDAGLNFATGEWIIIMDGDQQDPPEVIPKLIEKTKEGNKIVYGIRHKRTEPFPYNFLMKAFYVIWVKLSGINVPKDAGNFGIMHRQVVNSINSIPEQQKFIRGLRAWTGFKSAGVKYQRDKRVLGESKFSFSSYLAHAVNGITSFSVMPLRLLFWGGLSGVVISIFLSAFFGLSKILEIGGIPFLPYEIAPGFTSLAILMLLSTSINFLGLGIIGEYLGRVYLETKRRPNYVVDKVFREFNLISPEDSKSSICSSTVTTNPTIVESAT